MQEARIPLHAPVARLPLVVLSLMLWPALAGGFVAAVVAFCRHRFGLGNLLMPIFALPFWLVMQWIRSNATRVFATAEGLELTDRRRTIAWQSVASAYPVALPSM